MDSGESFAKGFFSVAYVTVPNDNVAESLARGLVERKLAACVNIIPGLKSIYEWNGVVEEGNELLLMIKTKTSVVEELTSYVRAHHPYAVAEVIVLPIEGGNMPYLQWLNSSVPDKS
uniref:CutA1 divalent ion tolerance protein n=1 Tax=Trichuris muris TaxID=70415 RepID=A0A5S6R5A2_TRIMR